MRSRLRRLFLVACLALDSCNSCKHTEPARRASADEHDEHDEHDEDDGAEEQEEQEERNANRDNYWRVQIAITGQGTVKTTVDTFDCTSDGVTRSGRCGPTLLRFKELQPPLLRATGAPTWRFDHWESSTRRPDGSVRKRAGPMPDSRLYLNGFGYSDTGELETVTAVFVRALAGSDDSSDDHEAGFK
jgi:hypothetical protein